MENGLPISPVKKSRYGIHPIGKKDPRILEGYREIEIGIMSFSPDGTMLANGSFHSTIKKWDTSNWTEI